MCNHSIFINVRMTVRFLELRIYVLFLFILDLASFLDCLCLAKHYYLRILLFCMNTSNDFKCLTKTRHRIVIMLIQILKKAVVSLSFIMSHYGQTSFLRYILFTIWFGFEYYNVSKISEHSNLRYSIG